MGGNAESLYNRVVVNLEEEISSFYHAYSLNALVWNSQKELEWFFTFPSSLLYPSIFVYLLT